MKSKIPPEAFEFYVGLGPARSYDAVGDHYGASKTAVANFAKRERWTARLARVELEAQERADQRAIESIQEMNSRHLKIARVIQHKALETLKTASLQTAMDAVRALEISIRHERLIRGEPSERTAHTTESVIRQQFERWMSDEPQSESGVEGAGKEDSDASEPDAPEDRPSDPRIEEEQP